MRPRPFRRASTGPGHDGSSAGHADDGVSARQAPDDGVSVAWVLPLSAEDAWGLLADVRNHARWVPFTRVRLDAPTTHTADVNTPTPAGARFTAVTAPLPRAPGLVDRMVVEDLTSPRSADDGPSSSGLARYRKHGPVLLGSASLHVRPLGPATCQVVWGEDVHLRGLPRAWSAQLLRPVARSVVALTLRRVAREVSGRVPAG